MCIRGYVFQCACEGICLNVRLSVNARVCMNECSRMCARVYITTADITTTGRKGKGRCRFW